MFQSPFGDRSRQFMTVQSRRLEDLAARQQRVGHQVRKLSGSLRPVPPPAASVAVGTPVAVVAEVDWPSSWGDVEATVVTCPVPGGPTWDQIPLMRDPVEIVPLAMARAEVAAATPRDKRHIRDPMAIPPAMGGQVWRFDVPGILAMAARFRRIADAVEHAGRASRNELADTHPAVPARLRASTQSVGVVTARVCGDVARRLRDHATGLERRMHDPRLLGVGPSYGVGSFVGPPPQLKSLEIELDMDTAWLDEVRVLHVVMEELLRGLPLSYGSAAEDVINAVGGAISGHTPRPPSPLPPIRFVPPEDLPDPTRLVVDPVTGVTMTAAEYFSRYGNPFASGLPAPLVPISDSDDTAGPQQADPTGSVGQHDSSPTADLPEDDSADSDPSVDIPVGSAPDDAVSEAPTQGSRLADLPSTGGGSAEDWSGGSAGGSSGAWSDVPAAALPDETSAAGMPSDLGPTALLGSTQPAVGEGESDADVAVKRGGVRITGEGAAVLGGLAVAGAGSGLLVTRRASARKVTSWVRYKARTAATRTPTEAPA